MDKHESQNPRYQVDNDNVEHEKGIGIRKCPVCNEVLERGMLVKSKLYKGKNDKIMHVFGCPYCWPDNLQHTRICPVCGNEIPRGGYLIARYFDDHKQNHVHVLGCNACRRG